jgi:hypothetical protein
MKPVKEMTAEEMDAWLSNAYSLMKVSGQEAEAKAFYRAGEFVRELGNRLKVQEELISKYESGYKGGCWTCESVGELNVKLGEQLKETPGYYRVKKSLELFNKEFVGQDGKKLWEWAWKEGEK